MAEGNGGKREAENGAKQIVRAAPQSAAKMYNGHRNPRRSGAGDFGLTQTLKRNRKKRTETDEISGKFIHLDEGDAGGVADAGDLGSVGARRQVEDNGRVLTGRPKGKRAHLGGGDGDGRGVG